MKKFLLLGICIAFSSCNSKDEVVIVDYIKKSSNNGLDVVVKINNIDKIQKVFTGDSLLVLREEVEKEKKTRLEDAQYSFDLSKEFNDLYEPYIKSEKQNELNKWYFDRFGEHRLNMIEKQKIIDLYQGDCVGSPLEPTIIRLKQFEKKRDSVLAIKYRVHLSVRDSVEGESKSVRRFYYLNPEKTKVLAYEERF